MSHLLLEGIEDAVDEELLEPGVNIGSAQVLDDLIHRLHDHAAVRLALVLQVLHNAPHNLRTAHLQPVGPNRMLSGNRVCLERELSISSC